MTPEVRDKLLVAAIAARDLLSRLPAPIVWRYQDESTNEALNRLCDLGLEVCSVRDVLHDAIAEARGEFYISEEREGEHCPCSICVAARDASSEALMNGERTRQFALDEPTVNELLAAALRPIDT